MALDSSTFSESLSELTCHFEPPEHVPRTSARAQTCVRGPGGLLACHGAESTRKDPRTKEKKMPTGQKNILYIYVYIWIVVLCIQYSCSGCVSARGNLNIFVKIRIKMSPNERVWRISRSSKGGVSTTHRSYSQLTFFILYKKCSWSYRLQSTIWTYSRIYLVTIWKYNISGNHWTVPTLPSPTTPFSWKVIWANTRAG